MDNKDVDMEILMKVLEEMSIPWVEGPGYMKIDGIDAPEYFKTHSIFSQEKETYGVSYKK